MFLLIFKLFTFAVNYSLENCSNNSPEHMMVYSTISRKQVTTCFSLALIGQEPLSQWRSLGIVNVVSIFNELSFCTMLIHKPSQLLYLVLSQTVGSNPQGALGSVELAEIQCVGHHFVSCFRDFSRKMLNLCNQDEFNT